jgi:hypothetical protein
MAHHHRAGRHRWLLASGDHPHRNHWDSNNLHQLISVQQTDANKEEFLPHTRLHQRRSVIKPTLIDLENIARVAIRE